MIYQETKTQSTYQYHCKDIFGTLDIESPIQLDASLLDAITMKLMHMSSHSGKIKEITYTITKTSQWEDES
jgi:hypothetical protein